LGGKRESLPHGTENRAAKSAANQNLARNEPAARTKTESQLVATDEETGSWRLGPRRVIHGANENRVGNEIGRETPTENQGQICATRDRARPDEHAESSRRQNQNAGRRTQMRRKALLGKKSPRENRRKSGKINSEESAE
jgi:hypothetical protein